MRWKTGVCTWTFGPMPIDEIARRVRALGFDGIELHGDLHAFKPAFVAEVLADHGLEVFSLTPDNVDLAHPDAGVRAGALDYYRRLIDFAAALGAPMVSCHGDVGRVRPLAAYAQEWDWLVEGLRALCAHARASGVPLVFEVLNRYESHLVNTAAQALDLLDAVGQPNLRVLLDAYHMNIEAADPAAAIRLAGARLGLFHVADSNRRGVGLGHTRFDALFEALTGTGYAGPVIVEATASGPDPFTAVKAGDYVAELEGFLAQSAARLRRAHPQPAGLPA